MRPLALAATLLLACAAPARHAAVPAPPPAAAVDAAAVLGPCPAATDEGARTDLAIVLWAQEARTAEEIRRAASEVELGPAALAEAAGASLDATHRPLTLALLRDAVGRARAAYGPAKERCGRPRPYDADPRVRPAVEKERSFSFPSGHATIGALWARLLAELDPARAAALAERGRQIGFDRVRAGVHYPSDVAAGQRLGTALAEAWLAEPGLRARLAAVRAAEWPASP